MGRIAGLTVIINGDATQFNATLRNMRAEAASLKASMAALNKQLKLDPTNYDLIARKQAVMNEYIAQQRAQLAQTELAMRNMRNNWDNLNDTQKRNYVSLEGQAEKLRASIAELTTEAQAFGAGLNTSMVQFAARCNEASSSLSKLAATLAPISIATAALGAVSAYTAIDFESAFAGVRKTVNATEVEYEKLRQTALDFSTTKPISASNVAQIMELGGQLGVASDNLSEFADVIADLTVSTDLELEDAATYLAQFVNIAGDKMSMDQIDRLGATIADLGNNSATTESQIVLMSHRMVGALTNAGASVPEVLALATALSSTGIRAEMGGNAISTVVNKITRDVTEGTDTLQVWADTAGMSAEQFAEAWTGDGGSNMMETLLQVIKGMSDYKNENQELITLLDEMGITYMRQIDMMQRLSRVSGMTADYVNLANGAWESNTALVREATQRYGTTESQLKMALNDIVKLGIAIGNDLLPGIKGIASTVGSAANGLSEMDSSARGMILTIGAIGLLSAPIAKVGSAFASMGGKVVTAIGNIRAISGYLSARSIMGPLEEKDMARYTQGMTAYSKAMNVAKTAAMGLASVAATGLAIALISVAAKVVDNIKKQQAFEQALKRVGTAARDGIADANASADSIDNMRMRAESTAMSVDQLTESLNGIADAYWNSTNEAQIANRSMEDSLRVIEAWDGAAENSTQDRIDLIVALRNLNGELGTNYELMEDGTIAYFDEEQQIWKNVDALREYVRQKEYSNLIESTQKARDDAREGQQELQKNYLVAQANADSANAAASEYLDEYSGTQMYSEWKFVQLANAARDAEAALEQARLAMQESSYADAVFADSIGYYVSAMQAGDGSLRDFIATNSEVQTALSVSGLSMQGFETAVTDAGITLEAMSALAPEQLLTFSSQVTSAAGSAEQAMRNVLIASLNDAGISTEGFKNATITSLLAVYSALQESGGEMSAAVTAAVNEATDNAESVAYTGGSNTAVQLVQGGVDSINANAWRLREAWSSAVDNTLNSGNVTAEVRSPSRRTYRTFKHIVDGGVNAVKDNGYMLSDAWSGAVSNALNAADAESGKVSLSGLDADSLKHSGAGAVNIYIDGAIVNDYAEIQNATGEYLQTLRRNGVI